MARAVPDMRRRALTLDTGRRTVDLPVDSAGHLRRVVRLDGAPKVTRAAGDDGPIGFVGHAALFNQRTWIGSKRWGFWEEIAPGAFSKTIQEAGVERSLVFNKGALMLLPGGVTKGTGLLAALAAMDLSPHNVVAVGDGENDHAFLSLADPPVRATAAAASCVNLHSWPVLAGPAGNASIVLSSPVILPDHPALAPESTAEFYDGTEIDEMLALPKHDLADADSSDVRERIPEQRVRLRTRSARGRHVVGVVEVHEVDGAGWHEVGDLDGLRRGNTGLVEVLVGQHDVLPSLVLVALHDLGPGNLPPFLLAEPPVVDRAAVLPVEQPEGELALPLDRREEADGDGHETEAERALPDGSCRHALGVGNGDATDGWHRTTTG